MPSAQVSPTFQGVRRFAECGDVSRCPLNPVSFSGGATGRRSLSPAMELFNTTGTPRGSVSHRRIGALPRAISILIGHSWRTAGYIGSRVSDGAN